MSGDPAFASRSNSGRAPNPTDRESAPVRAIDALPVARRDWRSPRSAVGNISIHSSPGRVGVFLSRRAILLHGRLGAAG
jgi:hypothetical protein